jgi:geranylgeranyl reductase family protein
MASPRWAPTPSSRSDGFDADVIVAGAGPAGAVAAATLAAAGIDVLLVDRARFPRNKPCGGALSARALVRFPWLDGLLASIDVLRVRKLHLEGPAGTRLDLEHHEPCVLLVRRVELDAALVARATHLGARFDDRFEITQAGQDAHGVTIGARDGRRLRARMIIAADGVHSVLAKRLDVNHHWPRTHVAIDMMEETPIATLAADRPDVLWLAYAPNGLDGYAYVFPKVRHVNVGIGCVLAHFDRAVHDAPYVVQQRFVQSLTSRGVLHGRSDRRTFTPYLIPVGGPIREAARGRVLFVGDAGGFVHAITAEGIYYAMVTGELAGRAIARARGGQDPARAAAGYQAAWRRDIGAELDDAVTLQRYLFASHARVAEIIHGAAGAPALASSILGYFKGHVPYARLRRRILLRFPLAILRLARAVRRPARQSA